MCYRGVCACTWTCAVKVFRHSSNFIEAHCVCGCCHCCCCRCIIAVRASAQPIDMNIFLCERACVRRATKRAAASALCACSYVHVKEERRRARCVVEATWRYMSAMRRCCIRSSTATRTPTSTTHSSASNRNLCEWVRVARVGVSVCERQMRHTAFLVCASAKELLPSLRLSAHFCVCRSHKWFSLALSKQAHHARVRVRVCCSHAACGIELRLTEWVVRIAGRKDQTYSGSCSQFVKIHSIQLDLVCLCRGRRCVRRVIIELPTQRASVKMAPACWTQHNSRKTAGSAAAGRTSSCRPHYDPHHSADTSQVYGWRLCWRYGCS